MIELSIIELLEKQIDNKNIIVFKIKVYINNSKTNWIIEKSYNEIYELNKSLLKLYKNITRRNKKANRYFF